AQQQDRRIRYSNGLGYTQGLLHRWRVAVYQAIAFLDHFLQRCPNVAYPGERLRAHERRASQPSQGGQELQVFSTETLWPGGVDRLNDANNLIMLLERHAQNRAGREPCLTIDPLEKPWVL